MPTTKSSSGIPRVNSPNCMIHQSSSSKTMGWNSHAKNVQRSRVCRLSKLITQATKSACSTVLHSCSLADPLTIHCEDNQRCVTALRSGKSKDIHFLRFYRAALNAGRLVTRQLSVSLSVCLTNACIVRQDAQLSQRDRAAGCVIVFAKSRTLERGDNDLRIL